MNGIHFHDSLRFVTDLPVPERRPGEALLRIRLAGICRTDLEIAAGYMGFSGVLGHEFVADVVDTDDTSLVGRRVVGEINAACGRCPACTASRRRHCPNRTVLGILGRDGVFAEFALLPEANLHLVPEPLSDTTAVFTEPVAAACRILEQVAIEVGSRVAVFGDGRLGHIVAYVLRDAGAAVTVIGRHDDRLKRLREAGFEARSTAEGLFPLTVDCTGHPEGFDAALAATTPTGTLVLKSTYAGDHHPPLAPVVIDEITVVGSRCGPFEPALDALARGVLPVETWVHDTFPLSAGSRAFDEAKRTLKVLIRP